MSVDSAILIIETADTAVSRNDFETAYATLSEAVQQLREAGSEIFGLISESEFESPAFQIVKRITALFPADTMQTGLSAGLSGVSLPETDQPQDILNSVQRLFEAETESETQEETQAEPSMSRMEFLLSLLRGQQSMRDAIFSKNGLYQTAADSVSPYLTGFLNYTGDAFETAEAKSHAMLFGPAKRLAELFYSLLTSSFTAGLLLLLIRRLIPILRPSKASTAINAAVLTAANLPIIIAGLYAVADELKTLREIIQRT